CFSTRAPCTCPAVTNDSPAAPSAVRNRSHRPNTSRAESGERVPKSPVRRVVVNAVNPSAARPGTGSSVPPNRSCQSGTGATPWEPLPEPSVTSGAPGLAHTHYVRAQRVQPLVYPLVAAL